MPALSFTHSFYQLAAFHDKAFVKHVGLWCICDQAPWILELYCVRLTPQGIFWAWLMMWRCTNDAADLRWGVVIIPVGEIRDCHCLWVHCHPSLPQVSCCTPLGYYSSPAGVPTSNASCFFGCNKTKQLAIRSRRVSLPESPSWQAWAQIRRDVCERFLSQICGNLSGTHKSLKKVVSSALGLRRAVRWTLLRHWQMDFLQIPAIVFAR